MSQKLIYITAGSEDEAATIARTLVAERLAACANVFPPIRSFYWWEGKVRDDAEVVLIAKTTEALVPRLIERVKALHSYDCPCVVALSIEDGNPEFLDWIDGETADG